MKKEREFWSVQNRAQSKVRQMKLKDLDQEKEDAKMQEHQPSTSYGETSSN